MISFTAINQSSKTSKVLDRARFQKEAKESENTALYEKALTHQSAKRYDEAEQIYNTILESDLISSIDESEPNPLGDPSVLLKYLVLKNSASIHEQRGQVDKAVDKYIKAAEIDDSDPSLWYHLGLTAKQTFDYRLSRQAFERTLLLQPRHWLSLNQLLDVLYIIEDHDQLQAMCQQALQLTSIFSEVSKFWNS